jgi:hypothetical protein
VLIDLPAIDAILAPRRREMRDASPILHTTQKESDAVLEEGDTSIENGMSRVGPVPSGKDGILGMPVKENFVRSVHENP